MNVLFALCVFYVMDERYVEPLPDGKCINNMWPLVIVDNFVRARYEYKHIQHEGGIKCIMKVLN